MRSATKRGLLGSLLLTLLTGAVCAAGFNPAEIAKKTLPAVVAIKTKVPSSNA